MSKKVNAKAASVLLTAAMVGSTVPAPVFAAAADETEDVHVSTLAQGEEGTEDSEITIPETTPGETEDSGSEETGGETDGTEDGRTIIYNGFDSVTMDGSMDLGSFLNEILTMAGFSLPDEASTDQIRLDWVGSDGYRTRLRVGNAEADAAMSVQTLDGLCELASSEANGLSLVVFRDEAGEMLRMVFSVDADGTVRINNQGAVPDGAYIVRFYGNGGTLGKSMNVMRMSGEKLSYIEQTATWDEDHKFLGWFTEAEGGEAVTEDTVVTSNMKVYAQWDATKFTLTFDTQGGDPVESQTVEIGDAVKKLPTPVREGYTFLGWFDAAEGGNPVKSIDAMTGDVTLYAHWLKEEEPGDPDNNNPGDNNNGDNTNNGDNNNNNQDPDDNNDNQNNGQNNNGNNNNTNNGQNNNGNNNNNQQEEQTERYALSIISPTGTKTEVGVDSDVTLGALAEKLGYTVSSWGLKTATTEERAADANITMKDIADVAEGSEVLLIAYNADGTAMGSAKVTKTGDGTYQVSLSKDTNVELSEMNGKGKGEGEGEGEENTPTPDTQNPGGSSGTGTGVSNSGKGDSVATSVDTADSLALPVYGGLSALLTTALGALAVIKKKFLK